ncbi:WhiB family transcriptional regulator [Streptomyces longwoodensis]|uniref:WhiB family transcriptional regulator n=1 Tax=Streptomyces longwoodensis TaxID=68231 RepID=UPI0033CABB9B
MTSTNPFAGPRPTLDLGIPDFVLEAREHVPCRADPDAYFKDGLRPREARLLCQGCEHVDPCAAFALERPELSGVWGGTTTEERRAVRRRSRTELAA